MILWQTAPPCKNNGPILIRRRLQHGPQACDPASHSLDARNETKFLKPGSLGRPLRPYVLLRNGFHVHLDPRMKQPWLIRMGEPSLFGTNTPSMCFSTSIFSTRLNQPGVNVDLESESKIPQTSWLQRRTTSPATNGSWLQKHTQRVHHTLQAHLPILPL